MGAFARDRQERKKWWDDHLWLQMLTIGVLCLIVGVVGAMNLIVLLVGTAVFLAVVYVLARLMIRGQRRV